MKIISLGLIKCYQKILSPLLGLLGFHCRFYPTCSEYSYLAIKKYGIIKGIYKGSKRILKCNPLCEGGVDNP